MVIVYSTPGCPQCVATYKQLDKHGIEYRVVDITVDPVAFEYVIGLGYQKAPVVVVDEVTHWAGFRPDLILKTAANIRELVSA